MTNDKGVDRSAELRRWLFGELVNLEDEQKRKEFADLLAPFFCDVPMEVMRGTATTSILPPAMPPNVIDETKRHAKTGSAPPRAAFTPRGGRTEAILAAIGSGFSGDIGELAAAVYGTNDSATRNRTRSLLHSLQQRGKVKNNRGTLTVLKS